MINKNSEIWLISGAGRGIGLAMTQAHLERGGTVLATYRNALPESLSRLEDNYPKRLIPIRFDQQQTLTSDEIAQYVPGPLDVIVHNAGVYGPRNSSLEGLDYTGILNTFDTNTLGVLRVSEAFLPFMKDAANPKIAAISSLLGTPAKAGPNDMAYRLSKAALNMAMHVMAANVAPQKIATACLRPGHVRTDMGGPNGAISPDESASALLTVIDQMTFSAKPVFLDLTGEPLAW
ncbi:SDR family NAD(P)-dependent oxidoreductase [Neptunicoccus cionae]|nr:SDR family NAD(P)-dependent oxidoreductase [Amylibacter cionae]